LILRDYCAPGFAMERCLFETHQLDYLKLLQITELLAECGTWHEV
jgi:hypothetical protein